MTFRKLLTYSILVWSMLAAHVVVAQTQQPTATSQDQNQVPPSPPAAPPQPFAFRFKKTVGFLRVGFLDQDTHSQMISGGTAFIVSYPDPRLGQDKAFSYLVTNRHVVQPGIEQGHPNQAEWMTLRINRKDAKEASEDEPLPDTLLRGWHFPSDPSVDLAVVPLAINQARYDFVALPLSMFATQDVVDKLQIAEGDTVLFTGFFYQIQGMKKFEPIVREGILAMIPYENLATTLGKSGRVYLADVRAFHGNSGSPLLVNVAGVRNGSVTAGYDYRLLGVISGFYHEDADLKLTIATTFVGKLEENSGIAMVVPADDLKALLESPDLRLERDAVFNSQNTKKN